MKMLIARLLARRLMRTAGVRRAWMQSRHSRARTLGRRSGEADDHHPRDPSARIGMSTWFDQPQSRFLVAAIVTLSLAAVVIKWAGTLLRGQLGAGGSRGAGDFRTDMTANVPPALMREALEKGLVTAGQPRRAQCR